MVALTGVASIHGRAWVFPPGLCPCSVQGTQSTTDRQVGNAEKGRRVRTGPPLSKGFSFKASHPRRELPMWPGGDFSITSLGIGPQ